MLLGRRAEVTQLDALLQRARTGTGGSLILRGEPGVGKTALLRYVADAATDMRILSASGIESDAELPYSGLADLLRPIQHERDALPVAQRVALETALGLGPPAGAERFAVQLGALGLLAAAAERLPVVVLVDDAQWLDASSLAAMLFCARRLRDAPVAQLFTARGDAQLEGAVGIAQLMVAGLDEGAALQLVSDAAQCEVSPAVAQLLHGETAGNPLALTEIASRLDPRQLDGRSPLPSPLPLGAGLELAFSARVAELPLPAQRALLLAAATDSPETATIFKAIAKLGLPSDALAAAERDRLVSIVDGRLAFRHPLVRSATYQRASPHERRAAHRAIASVLTRADERDRRAWHLAMAAAAPDAEVANELEAVAQQALVRGSQSSAAVTLERAARLTPDASQAARRAIAAADLWERAGVSRRALALIDAAPRADPLSEAQRAQVRGRILLWGGDPQAGRDLLLAAAEDVEPHSVAQAAALYADASFACTAIGDCARALDIARRSFALAPDADPARLAAMLSLAQALMLTGSTREGRALATDLTARARALPSNIGTGVIAYVPMILDMAEDFAEARTLATRIIASARDLGLMAPLAYLLASLALIERSIGELQRAHAAAVEAVQLAIDTGLESDRAFASYCLTYVECALGLEEAARRDGRETMQRSRALGIGSLVTMTATGLGSLEVALQRPEAALASLEIARDLLTHQGMRQPIIAPWQPEYIEALVQLGRHAEALPVLEEFASRIEHAGSAWGAAVAMRCRALLAPAADAAPLFEAALALHSASPTPIERARTELHYGQLLRRHREIAEARRHLHAALATFERTGARAWAERARAALAAAGERVTPSPEALYSRLTPQELQVCLAVVDGATNREVASRLFLSTRTIETHLSSAYRKLEVRSRTELTALFARR